MAVPGARQSEPISNRRVTLKLYSMTLLSPTKLFGRTTPLSSVSVSMDGVGLEWNAKLGMVVVTMRGVDGEEWIPAAAGIMRWRP